MGGCQRHAPAALTPGKRPGTHVKENKEDKVIELYAPILLYEGVLISN